jgi:hypothetical protein
MGICYKAEIIIGEFVEFKKIEIEVTKYDENTGKPYLKKEIKTIEVFMEDLKPFFDLSIEYEKCHYEYNYFGHEHCGYIYGKRILSTESSICFSETNLKLEIEKYELITGRKAYSFLIQKIC